MTGEGGGGPGSRAPPPGPVGIVGLGLIGGSLARALKSLAPAPEIRASSLDRAELERAREDGVVDVAAAGPREAAAGAALVVYATPLAATLSLLEAHRSVWAPGAVVTDVTGLKAPVVERARALGIGARFVGGHPMAGREGSGYRAGRGDLFRGARVWLSGEASPEARGAVEGLWRAVGARPAWIEAGRHDELVAWTSHLPQLVANAVALALEREGVDPGELGPGGRDVTRLAGSPPDLWNELLAWNRGRTGRALAGMLRELRALAEALDRGDLDAVTAAMARSREWRAGGGGA